MDKVTAISVTQLARRVRNLLEIQIGELWVEGEISNLRKQSSGHWYFSLKDESAQISCAMFSAKRRTGHEVIQDGAKVQIFGETSFYEARGSTQLIVRKAQAVGLGDLQARFEALKKKLNTEGLFDQTRKRVLPKFPRVIGLVTSPSGAALQDMLNVLNRRSPWLTVVLFPAAVQGRGAERGIASAIRRAGNAEAEDLPQPEVLIVGRGGGSLEDLWNFNEETVARAIAACPIPVISAVGHEIDFTIADFVADLRAPTPSAAAELVAPDQQELRDRIENLSLCLTRAIHGRMDRFADQLDYYERGVLGQSSERALQQTAFDFEERSRRFRRAADDFLRIREHHISQKQASWGRYHPREVMKREVEKLSEKESGFLTAARSAIATREAQLEKFQSVLTALGPGSVLQRGFTITQNGEGKLITSADEAKEGDLLKTTFSDGTLESRVESSN